MGKTVICANHPSNEFFKHLPNCRTYDDSNGFVKATCSAVTEEPYPLTDSQRYELSWEAATERFLKVAELDQSNSRQLTKTPSKNFMSISMNVEKIMDEASANLHFLASGFELSRRVFGAIPGTLKPDEQLCRELGLVHSAGKDGTPHGENGSSYRYG